MLIIEEMEPMKAYRLGQLCDLVHLSSKDVRNQIKRAVQRKNIMICSVANQKGKFYRLQRHELVPPPSENILKGSLLSKEGIYPVLLQVQHK